MKILLPLFLLFSIKTLSQDLTKLYETETLLVYQLTANTMVHVSYLETDNYGKVACNGMIFKDGDEAAVFDTPANDSASSELINWLQNEQKLTVKAVVATHWHKDCLGGMDEFHKHGAASYANQLTLQLAEENNYPIPQNGFKKKKALDIGKAKVYLAFLGAGHTFDNIVTYVPSEKVIFGGCLIKSLKAGKGWTGDGDTSQWSTTVSKVKSRFPDAEHIIPGHGKTGDQSLLDYTMEMFGVSKQ